MTPEQFDIEVGGERVGPFSKSQLREMLDNGEVDGQARCAPSGTEDWRALNAWLFYANPESWRQLKHHEPASPPQRRPATQGEIATFVFLVLIVVGTFWWGISALGMAESVPYVIGFCIGVPVYFLPSLIASSRHRNFAAIVALNLLLGWTVLGWVAALVWALYRDKPTPVTR